MGHELAGGGKAADCQPMWVTMWVRQLTHILAHTFFSVLATKKHRKPKFSMLFVAKTLKKVWVKMWVNCLTHTVTHTRNYPERSNEYRRGSFCLLSGIFAFSAYMTCAMKLPIFSAAFCCICLVAWV